MQIVVHQNVMLMKYLKNVLDVIKHAVLMLHYVQPYVNQDVDVKMVLEEMADVVLVKANVFQRVNVEMVVMKVKAFIVIVNHVNKNVEKKDYVLIYVRIQKVNVFVNLDLDVILTIYVFLKMNVILVHQNVVKMKYINHAQHVKEHVIIQIQYVPGNANPHNVNVIEDMLEIKMVIVSKKINVQQRNVVVKTKNLEHVHHANLHVIIHSLFVHWNVNHLNASVNLDL
mmetsp:Transcript_44483/g.54458  ORF Transcript_44483/g.54458 Transcript_44483/m.54458 type:complete len:227 (+) Transcript_44483:723-1403(+)